MYDQPMPTTTISYNRRQPTRPWLVAVGGTGGTEKPPQCFSTLAAARHAAGLLPLPRPVAPVSAEWVRQFLQECGISPALLATILTHSDDRLVRRWKQGELAMPLHIAELLAAWADRRPPELSP